VLEGPLYRLYAALVNKREQGSAEKADTKKILLHPLYKCLQQLVCLYLHTIAAPVRVSIVRSLQFRTTFVKLRNDPSRYVIDLKNNPNSPSARHKTSAHYRNAILPQQAIERMTHFIDKLRSYKLTELNPKRFVFVNQNGEQFSETAWTAFVKRSWGGLARVPSANADGERPPRQPPPSLCRTIFVTWLNSVPYNDQDRVFLDKMQQTAADFQTHTLETANTLYDKDAASYERLLALTKFCEQWSLSVTGGALNDEQWDENLDSDHERFDAVAPVARSLRDPSAVQEADGK
jgi:hypothetical protein